MPAVIPRYSADQFIGDEPLAEGFTTIKTFSFTGNRGRFRRLNVEEKLPSGLLALNPLVLRISTRRSIRREYFAAIASVISVC